MTHDTKLIGDISEHMVSVELLKRNFAVLNPVGDRLPFDRAIWFNNKIVTLQIRTAWHNHKKDHYCGNVRNSKTNRKEYKFVKSNTKDVNFFVFVIQDLNIFYIVPSSVIDTIKSEVILIPHRKRATDSKNIEFYKENWKLLQESF